MKEILKVKCDKCKIVYWENINTSNGKCCICKGKLYEYMGTRFDDYETKRQLEKEFL